MIVSILLVVYLALKAGLATMPIQLPVSDDALLIGVASLNLLFVIIGFADSGPSGVGFSWGIFVALVAAAAALYPYVWPFLQPRLAKRG